MNELYDVTVDYRKGIYVETVCEHEVTQEQLDKHIKAMRAKGFDATITKSVRVK